MDYKALLKRAKELMPEVVFERERFEIPKVRGHIEGHYTVLSNFVQIASHLHRPIEHLLKFTLRALATSGELRRNNQVYLKSKIAASRINAKIKAYAHNFVLCQVCGKPDTEMKKEGVFMFVKCQACGAKKQIKSKL
jgi:translation initiation factor 2 subunit 2